MRRFSYIGCRAGALKDLQAELSGAVVVHNALGRVVADLVVKSENNVEHL